MMEIVLQGDLGDRFGRHWRVAGSSFADAMACIDANNSDFRKALVELHEAGGDLSIQLGDKIVESNEELFSHLGKDTIIITPIPTGSKSGTQKAIVGTLMLIAAVVITVMNPGLGAALWEVITMVPGAALTFDLATISVLSLGAMGVQLLSVGLQQILAPDPSVDEDTRDYSFEGPENTSVSNTPIPILCGEMIIGGTVISSGVIGTTPPVSGGIVIRPAPRDSSGGNGGGVDTVFIDNSLDAQFGGPRSN